MMEGGSIQIFENDILVYKSEQSVLPFSSAFLYLQMSSHSNYRPREIFFDDILVREACEEE